MKVVMLVLGFFGGLIAAQMGDEELIGALLGAGLLWTLYSLIELKRRVVRIEQAEPEPVRYGPMAQETTAIEPVSASSPVPGPDSESESRPDTLPDPESQTPLDSAPEQAVDLPPAMQALTEPEKSDPPAPPPSIDPWARGPEPDVQRPVAAASQATHTAAVATDEPDVFTGVLRRVKEWLTSGNVPVKVGVIVSFFGVAFFLKYAAENNLLVIPIEIRLLAVAAFGVAMLVMGWRWRERMPVYALSLQGGGIGVMYLVIFAAMRFYAIIGQIPAFGLMIALTGFAGMLAVLQNNRALAILGIIGGFLAPVLISTGSGNHVALFSYYLLLNAAILGIAWFRAWRELNLIGFAFTFVIGGMWGYENYQPEHFNSTEPFLILYFLFYQAVAILYAARQRPKLRGLIDGTLVFAAPVVAFALQTKVVAHFEYGLAISAAVTALGYALTATVLYRLRGGQFRLLVESFMVLAVAFATLAVPLALDARWTATAWALEGTALVWIGCRQNRLLARLAGVALLFASGISFVAHGWEQDLGLPVLNGNYLGALLIGLSALFSARRLSKDSGLKPGPMQGLFRLLGSLLFFWGCTWVLGAGLLEISDRVTKPYQSTLLLAYLALLGAVTAMVARKLNWEAARATLFAYLPLLFMAAVLAAFEGGHPGANYAWLAWLVAAYVQYRILHQLEPRYGERLGILHGSTLVGIAAVLIWEIVWQLQQLQVGEVWGLSLSCSVPGIVLLAVLALSRVVDWPIRRHLGAYLGACGGMIALQLLSIGMVNLVSNGDPAPLAYIPILNPLDIATAFSFLVSLLWLRQKRTRGNWGSGSSWNWTVGLLSFLALLGSTAALVRGVHHYAAVPWDFDALAGSVRVQAALSIYWGTLGLLGMAWGARKLRRTIWLAGAALMSLVVIKLFLVDLGNTGTIERIVSFIGTGLLLLIVGFLAPAPPRAKAETVEPDPQSDEKTSEVQS